MRWWIWTGWVVQGLACGNGDPDAAPGAKSVDQATSEADLSARSVHQMTLEERRAAVGDQPAIGNMDADGFPILEAAEPQQEAAPEPAEPAHCTTDLPEASAELMNPGAWSETAPETYRVLLDTTSGPITLAVTRAWSPLGADRFYNMVRSEYLTDIAWFRVVPDFVAQGGMHGNPEVNKAWSEATIDDDEVLQSNARGMVSFATSGKNSRSNQFFINFKANKNLDGMGFSPFAQVVEGMESVDAIYRGHGQTPNQGRIGAQGDAYLCGEFPELDRIKSASIVD